MELILEPYYRIILHFHLESWEIRSQKKFSERNGHFSFVVIAYEINLVLLVLL